MPHPAELQSTLRHIIGYGDEAAPKIALAVSGGPDSMALLWLMKQYYHGEIYAVSVDHGLRYEAKDEADHVASVCHSLHIPHQILRPADKITGNIQSEARKARYQLLQGFISQNGYDFIATAHHADDQLETVIMRLNRGSGVSGLAAIRERNDNIIRPLLSYRKADLVKICQDADIAYIEDPSNENDDYDRVKVRKWLRHIDIISESEDMPALFKPDMVQKSAQHADQAELALQYSAQYYAKNRIKSQNDVIILDASQLPQEYERRLLLIALQQLSSDISPRGGALENLIKELKNNEISMIGNIKCTPITTDHNIENHIWQLELAPPRRH